MTDYTTMRVPTPAWERAKNEKRDGETWGEYLQRCTDHEPEHDPVGVDVDELAREVSASIDYAELANQVATELEGRMR